MNKTIKYKAKGHVLGNLWGGGEGAYPTRKYEADTPQELYKKINDALKDGSLDSGMGFESLKGAVMNIEIIKTIEVDEQDYSRSEFESQIFGNLNRDEIDFLFECDLF